MTTTNYTLGRGIVYFARFESGETPGPYLDVGNAPEINLTIETENLPHVSSRSGVREEDDSVALSITRTGTLTLDDIKRDNLALFFFGSDAEYTQAVRAAADEDLFTAGTADETLPVGSIYNLGYSAQTPAGIRNITYAGFTLMNDATTLKRLKDLSDPLDTEALGVNVVSDEANADYRVNFKEGLVTLLKDITVGAGNDLVANYAAVASKYRQITSGTQPVQGSLLFVEDNPKGDDNQWLAPKVTVRPNGDMSLIGDEWRSIPLALTIEKPGSGEALYINGEPTV